jgi:hypothetical protein
MLNLLSNLRSFEKNTSCRFVVIGVESVIRILPNSLSHVEEFMAGPMDVKGGVRIGKTPKKLASICCP